MQIKAEEVTGRRKQARDPSILIVIVLFALLCFLTACQPTPQTEAVVQKDRLEVAILDPASQTVNDVDSVSTAQINEVLLNKLGAPQIWTLETTALNGKLNIKADVPLQLPPVTALPVATATLVDFTNDDLSAVTRALSIDGAEWREVSHVQTKEELTTVLAKKMERIEELRAENADVRIIEAAEESLVYSQRMYHDAPYESELNLQVIELGIGQIARRDMNGQITEYEAGFEGTTQYNGQAVYLFAGSANRSDRILRIQVSIDAPGLYLGGVFGDTPYGIGLTKEEAGAQAIMIAEQLSNELTLCAVMPVGANKSETPRNWGWACVFMREINGCPTAFESTEIGGNMDSIVIERVPYEQMTIVLDDMGLVGFSWYSKMGLDSIDNADVALLPFDSLSQRAIDSIAQQYAYGVTERIVDGVDVSDPGSTVTITKVELGLMRVAKRDSQLYYYVPVWNFFAEYQHTDGYSERTGYEPSSENYVDTDGNPTINYGRVYPQAWGAVTINAIDGSVIDRNRGY